MTTILFKLLKQFDQYNDNGVQLVAANIISKKQLQSNQAPKIDWHDWELIKLEKFRTGKTALFLLHYYVILLSN